MRKDALVTSYEVAFRLATQSEFLCGEQLGQAIEKHQDDGHAHDNHVVADAAEETKVSQAERTHMRKSLRFFSVMIVYTELQRMPMTLKQILKC